MTDIVDSKRRIELMAGIKGRDTAPERRVRRIAHQMGMGLRYRLYGKGPLDTSVFPFSLAYNRLLHPDTSDNGLDSGLPSRGTHSSAAAVQSPCHADYGGSGGASLGLSCGSSGPVLMSEQSGCTASLGKPAFKLDIRWYFHDQ